MTTTTVSRSTANIGRRPHISTALWWYYRQHWSHLRVSSGSCARISLLVRKIASKDVHCLCTVSISFKTVSTSPRVACQSVTCTHTRGVGRIIVNVGSSCLNRVVDVALGGTIQSYFLEYKVACTHWLSPMSPDSRASTMYMASDFWHPHKSTQQGLLVGLALLYCVGYVVCARNYIVPRTPLFSSICHALSGRYLLPEAVRILLGTSRPKRP